MIEFIIEALLTPHGKKGIIRYIVFFILLGLLAYVGVDKWIGACFFIGGMITLVIMNFYDVNEEQKKQEATKNME